MEAVEPSNEAPNPSDPTASEEVFYPTNDAERNWMFTQDIRKLVKQTLEPNQADRLLVELERLFLNYHIYSPY